MAKRATLTYEKDWYSPVYLRFLMSSGKSAIVRKEYTRLRDISQKRLKRLAKAGLTETEVYKKNVNHYPKLKDIKSDAELSARLSDLSRFISAERSTVSGFLSAIKKSIKTLHSHGYNFVTEKNYGEFAQFMKEYKYQKLDMLYDSGEAAETSDVLMKHHISPDQVKDDFEFWIQNREQFRNMRSMKKDWGNPDALKKRAERKYNKKSKKSK